MKLCYCPRHNIYYTYGCLSGPDLYLSNRDERLTFAFTVTIEYVEMLKWIQAVQLSKDNPLFCMEAPRCPQSDITDGESLYLTCEMY